MGQNKGDLFVNFMLIHLPSFYHYNYISIKIIIKNCVNKKKRLLINIYFYYIMTYDLNMLFKYNFLICRILFK